MTDVSRRLDAIVAELTRRGSPIATFLVFSSTARLVIRRGYGMRALKIGERFRGISKYPCDVGFIASLCWAVTPLSYLSAVTYTRPSPPGKMKLSLTMSRCAVWVV